MAYIQPVRDSNPQPELLSVKFKPFFNLSLAEENAISMYLCVNTSYIFSVHLHTFQAIKAERESSDCP